ncbi:tetratricopeptide repeat protein [Sinobaca sp. H24]|uniref:tetratricopeptide repeat protein n=1 Tax=Sinobaca sp. H24 TaxID=2923376 RepID=UPI002079A1AA|nr:tetratricopeptide repeat protein [Sinobaca sp. H24]
MLEKAIELLKNKEYNQSEITLLSLLKDPGSKAEAAFRLASLYDSQGKEKMAAAYYEKALLFSIRGELRERTYIQLGSTYRAVGEYEKAKECLEQGLLEYPENRAIQIFLAAVYYNIGESKKAATLLLENLAMTSSDQWVSDYKEALLFYAKDLDQSW